VRILDLLKRVRLRPFDRGDYSLDGERRIENTDAGASMLNPNPMAPGPATFPPNYVPPVDEGRPRH
jgi:hypothetical protein